MGEGSLNMCHLTEVSMYGFYISPKFLLAVYTCIYHVLNVIILNDRMDGVHCCLQLNADMLMWWIHYCKMEQVWTLKTL